jgi:8-amino-7-oxononanoate synthase
MQPHHSKWPHYSKWIEDWVGQLQDIDDRGGRRVLRVHDRSNDSGASMSVNGHPALNFGANDYLNLARHPLVIKRIVEVVEQVGWGSGASPLVSGRGPIHDELEKKLAEFEEAEGALLFPTGYAANMAAVMTLVGHGDVIFSDKLNHASLIDGCQLSGAETYRYRHSDIDHLETLLKRHRDKFKRAILVTDTLFSMDGDLAPVRELGELASRFDCAILADEAHATGVYGKNGAGWCHESGCIDQVLVRTGTISKSLGGLGGFLVGPDPLIQLAIHRGRGFMFSTAMPQAIAAAASVAIDLLSSMEQERIELRKMSVELRRILLEQGWQVGEGDSPIIPVYIGDPNRTMQLARSMFEQGCYVPAIRPPSVPVGKSLLRISLSVMHSREDVGKLSDCFLKLRQGTCGVEASSPVADWTGNE